MIRAVVVLSLLQTAPPAPKPNVLFISLDTTRADAIAPWGPGGVAPTLDALASESLVALRAHAPAPLTFPSHASMLTGLYPFAHGVRDNDLYQLDASAQTSARLLRDAGWRTEAVVAATVLRANTGLANGFEHYVDVKYRRSRNVVHNALRRGDEVSDLVLERIAVADPRPWFLWAHYFDPHVPYMAPDGPPATATTKERYDAEVRYVDAQIARVVAKLKETGALANTWIVVCGDHGEGLGIQQEWTHAYLCEQGTLRVPLFVRRPDGGLRGQLSTLATVADVHPTLLAIAGLEPVGAIHGRDLLAMFAAEQRGGPEADELAERTVWFETWAGWHVYGWSRLEGVIAGRFKYVRGLKDELFDLDIADPKALEKTNLAPERPEVVRAMQQRFSALQEVPVTRLDSATPNLPPEEVGRLLELGYLARSIGDDDTSTNGTLDPREHYQTSIDVEWALNAATEGKIDDAKKVLDAVIRKYPQSAVFREILGKVLVQGNRKPEAAKVFMEALTIDEKLVSANFYLGAFLREMALNSKDPVVQAKQFEAARMHLAKTVELSPLHLEGWLQLRATHNARSEWAEVLHDTIVVINVASALGDKDGDEIAQNSIDQWLPRVLEKLAADPRRDDLVKAAAAAIEPGDAPARVRAREILSLR